MKKPNSRIYILLGILSLSMQTGCVSKSAPTETSSSPAKTEVKFDLGFSKLYDIETPQECESTAFLQALPPNEQAFYCLRKLCESASGGQFNELRKTCECPLGSNFRSENRSGRCVQNSAELGILGSADYALSTVPQSAYEFKTVTNAAITPTTEVPFSALVRSKGTKFSISEYLKGDLDFRTSFLNNRRFFFSEDDYFVDMDLQSKLSLADLYESIANTRTNSVRYKSEFEIDFVPIYEPQAQYLGAALGDRTEIGAMAPDDRSRFFSIAATNPDESALSELQRVSLGAYRAYLKHNSSSLVQATYTFGSLAGCAEKCFIMQTLATNSTFVPSRYTVKLSRMYVLGNLEREVIYIFEPKQSQPAAVLALNAGQGVSFIMLRDDEGSSYTFYDRSWTQLGTHSMNSAVQSNRPSKITYNSPSGRDTNLQPPLMGVCQHRWNMSLLKQAGFLDQLTLADYSPGQNLAYRDPRTNLFALGPDGYTWWTHQSAMLEKIVAENKSLTLLPMTETQCFSTNSFLRWAPSATHDGLRTVLVMNSQEMTREICSSKYHKALSDPNIVWVVDAGSNGERNPSRLRCPQNALANTGTGLVVAASDNHEIDRYSNFGNEYADIAAPKGGEWSVYESFAAVTVARVVAEIGRAFPELDARSLRMAILLGAHIPNAEQPLDVRAGGILDEQRSHQIAMYLETARRQNKDVTDRDTTKTVLQNVFCGSSVQECHIAAVKLKLLLDAGVIK